MLIFPTFIWKINSQMILNLFMELYYFHENLNTTFFITMISWKAKWKNYTIDIEIFMFLDEVINCNSLVLYYSII